MSSGIGLALALAAAVCAAAVVIFHSLLADEIRAWLPHLARALVRSAARQLPATARARYEGDWLAELAAWEDRPLSAFAKAAHIRWGARGIRYSVCGHSGQGDRLKRVIDIGGAAALLLLLSPMLIGTALAIRLDSPGPVFFRAPGSGRNGERFAILKFRTMTLDAERHGDPRTVPLAPAATDPRITRVGRFLRRTSLNELPQLFNVLRGDMSLVGPRPLIFPEEPPEAEPEAPPSTVRPGLTGPSRLAAIRSDDPQPFDETIRRDAEYVRSRSLLRDLRLLARTVVAIFRGPK